MSLRQRTPIHMGVNPWNTFQLSGVKVKAENRIIIAFRVHLRLVQHKVHEAESITYCNVDGQNIARQRLIKHVNTHATVGRVAAPRPASLIVTQRRGKHISAAVSRYATIAAA
jgi:hypothetical protein